MRDCLPPTMCHMLLVTCHVSHVRFHVSGFMCNFFFYKLAKLVGGGSVINKACPVYFFFIRLTKINTEPRLKFSAPNCSTKKSYKEWSSTVPVRNVIYWTYSSVFFSTPLLLQQIIFGLTGSFFSKLF